MPLISLCYAWRDQAVAAEVAGRLRAAGAQIVAEAEAEQLLTPRQRGDGAAARAKLADVVAVIASDTPEGRGQARRAVRAALFYEKRIAPARLDPGVDFEAIARDPATRAGSPYDEEQDAAAAKVFAVADLRPARAADPDREEEAEEEARRGPPALSEAALSAYVAAILRQAEAAAKERPAPPADFDEAEMDDAGFPKTPAAMLARWRLVEASREVRDVEDFLIDYADEPYFSLRAAQEISERRAAGRRAAGALAYRVVTGMIVAGLLIWGVSAACGPDRCGLFGGDVATTAMPASLEEARGDIARLRGDRRALEAERERTLARLREAREERDALRRDLEERSAADAEAMEEQLAALRRERDGLQSALAIAQASIGAASISPASADAAETDDALREARAAIQRKDREIRDLRDAQESLRAAAGAARAEAERLRSEGGRSSDAMRAELDRARATVADLRERLAAAEAAQSAFSAPAVAVSPAEAADAAALVRLLRVAQEELESSYQRHLASLPPGAIVKGPYLTGDDIRLMQRCLRDVTGAPEQVDGLWGRLTSAALLAVGSQEAGAVAACLRQGSRAR